LAFEAFHGMEEVIKSRGRRGQRLNEIALTYLQLVSGFLKAKK
jgi:hypothetical protein